MKKNLISCMLVFTLLVSSLAISGCGSKDGDLGDLVGGKISDKVKETEEESSDDETEAEEDDEEGAESSGSKKKASVAHDEDDDTEDTGASAVTHFVIPGDRKGTVVVDLDGDGSEEEIDYRAEYDEFIIEHLTLTLFGEKYELTDGIYYIEDTDLNCCWIRDDDADHSQYLYIQQCAENDYKTVAMYWYTGDDLVYLDVIDGAIEFTQFISDDEYEVIGMEDPDDFLIRRREDVLGSQTYTERCRLDADGCPVCIEDYKYYTYFIDSDIVATETIPIMYLEDEETTEESPSVLDPGDVVIPYRTDGSTFIDLKVKGLEGLFRMYYSWDDGELSIIDKSGDNSPMILYECFDGMIYAG